MSEREEQYFKESSSRESGNIPGEEEANPYNFVKVIEVDSGRLKRIKINNISGRTRVIGTDRPQITIRGNSQFGLNFSPGIEFKQDGAELEIVASPGRGFNFNFGPGSEPPFDPDAVYQPPFETRYSEGEEWEYNDTYDFKERHKARDERRRQRFEVREFTRQAKEQAKEAARQAKRGFWSNFDPESITNFAVGLGRGLSDLAGSLGDLYLEVPNWIELDIKSVSGAVEISDIKAFCQVKNTSGVIKLQRLTGGLQLKGMSGRVEALELGGRATIKVNSGKVSLLNCNLSGLEMSVDNGNIDLETRLAAAEQGEYKINTANGSVRVRLPRESRTSIECRSLNGRITISPEIGPVEIRNRPGQNQSRIEMNGGGSKMSINTMNGRIELGAYGGQDWGSESMDRNWPHPPAPPAPPAPPSAGGWPVTPTPPPPPSAGGWVVPPSAPSAGGWVVPPSVPSAGVRAVPPSAPSAAPYPAPPVGFDTVSRPPEAGTNATPPPVASNEQPSAPEAAQEAATATPVRDETLTSPQLDNERRNKQMEILQAIERGEISVDEGMARLGQLEE